MNTVNEIKRMLSDSAVRIIFDKYNDNSEGFLYKRRKPSLGSIEVIVFSYIQVARNEGNCFVALCTINGKKCTRNIPELQLFKGEIKVVGDITNVKQPVRLLTSKWLFPGPARHA
jgi:hypothetical protein